MIKLSYDVKNYRKQISQFDLTNLTVIELGCHVGGTTKLLKDASKVIAIDNSPEAVNKMRELESDRLTFIKADVRLHETMLDVFKIIQKCDVLAIDLGGGYHPDTVFKVFYIWSSTFKPKYTFIRNRGLIEFSNSVESEEDFTSEVGYLESYDDEGIPPQIKEFDLWTPSLRKK